MMQTANRTESQTSPQQLLITALIAVCGGALVALDWRIGLFPIALLALGGIVYTLIYREEFFAYLLFVSAPLNDLIFLPVGGMNLRIYTLFTLLVFINYAWHIHTGLPTPSANIARTFFWFILIGIAFTSSKFITVLLMDKLPVDFARSFSLKYAILSALLFAYSIAVLLSIVRKEQLIRSLRYWIYLSDLIALIGLIQIIVSNTTSIEWVWHRDVTPLGRPLSLFREPDVFGSFMGANLILMLPIAVGRLRGVFSQPILIGSIALHLLLLLLSYVRAAWIAVVLAGAVYLFILSLTRRFRKLGKVLSYLLLTGVLTMGMIGVFLPKLASNLIERVGTLADPQKESASLYRLEQFYEMVKHAWAVYGDRVDMSVMLFGHGEFTWSFWGPILIGVDRYDQSLQEHLEHSGVLVHPGFFMPLTIWHDNGLIGLLLFILLYALLIGIFFVTLARTENEITQILLCTTFLPFLVITICFCFSYDPISPFYWGYIALYLSVFYHFYLHCSMKEVTMLKENRLLLWIHRKQGEGR